MPDGTMPEPAQGAVLNFLEALPGAATHLRPEELPWILDQLRDPAVASLLPTRLASALAKNLGSTILMTGAEYLSRVADALAVVWGQDEKVTGDLKDRELALWVGTIQSAATSGSPSSEEETTFRWDQQRRPLPGTLAAIHKGCGELDFPQRKVFSVLVASPVLSCTQAILRELPAYETGRAPANNTGRPIRHDKFYLSMDGQVFSLTHTCVFLSSLVTGCEAIVSVHLRTLYLAAYHWFTQCTSATGGPVNPGGGARAARSTT